MNDQLTAHVEKILNCPTASHWLKNAIKSSLKRDALDAWMDAEMLQQILKERFQETVNE